MSPSDQEQIEEIAFSFGVTAQVMTDSDFANIPVDEMTRLAYGESELEENVKPA